MNVMLDSQVSMKHLLETEKRKLSENESHSTKNETHESIYEIRLQSYP